MKYTLGSGNIFEDLGFPEGEAEVLKMRADLMSRVEEFCREKRMSRAKAAKTLGLSQARLSALRRGRVNRFTLDELVDLLRRAGFTVRLVVHGAA